MDALLATISIVVSLLLLTYYQSKANKDDYNRPSYFNSKFRKYFLFSFAVLLFVAGGYWLIIQGSYTVVWVIPILYYFAYLYYRQNFNHNVMITKVFQYYKAFSAPEIGYSKTAQLTAPIELILLQAGMPDEYCKKAHKYIEERIKSGKIKDVADLPQEAWTIFSCTGESEIVENDQHRIPVKKVRGYYEEVFEGKPQGNLTTITSDALWWLETRFERLFKNFSFVSIPRPDFTGAEVGLQDARMIAAGKETGTRLFAVFPQIAGEAAKKLGWVKDLDEYCALAALEFQRRYPKHKFSRKIKKQHKYSNQEIFDYAQNWERLDVSKIKVFL